MPFLPLRGQPAPTPVAPSQDEGGSARENQGVDHNSDGFATVTPTRAPSASTPFEMGGSTQSTVMLMLQHMQNLHAVQERQAQQQQLQTQLLLQLINQRLGVMSPTPTTGSTMACAPGAAGNSSTPLPVAGLPPTGASGGSAAAGGASAALTTVPGGGRVQAFSASLQPCTGATGTVSAYDGKVEAAVPWQGLGECALPQKDPHGGKDLHQKNTIVKRYVHVTCLFPTNDDYYAAADLLDPTGAVKQALMDHKSQPFTRFKNARAPRQRGTI